MAYPYGTQGAPAVGNGLGGLPRRATAAAAAVATTGPVQLKRFGTPYAITTTQNYTSQNLRIIAKASDTEFWCFYSYYDQSNYWYQIARITLAGDSVTGFSSYRSVANNSIPISSANATCANGILYTFAETGTNTDIYKYTPSRSAVTTTFPTSGTVTYGAGAGSAWALSVNSYNVESGMVGNGANVCIRTLSDGNLILFRAGTINSNKAILAHTINASTGALIATYGVFSTGDSTYFDGMSFMVISTGTDRFSVFCVFSKMVSGTDPTVYAQAGSVNISTNAVGTSYSGYGNTAVGRSYNGGNFFKVSDTVYRMKVGWTNLHTVNFPTTSEGVPNGTPTGSAVASGSAMLTDLIFDPVYLDNHPTFATLSTDPDLPSVVSLPSTLDVRPFVTKFAALNLTNEETLVSGSISFPTIKTLISHTTDANQSAWGPPVSCPYGVAARVSEYAFLVGTYDRNNSTSQTRFNLQMVRAE